MATHVARGSLFSRLAPVAAVSAALLALSARSACAQFNVDLASQTALRVCADPSNMPFSDRQQQGFENKIADLLAAWLKLPVHYTWTKLRPGFLRNTLFEGSCDVVMGTVAGGGMVDNSNAYYHTGYVIVTRDADHITATSLGAPVFATKRFGLVSGTPPSDILQAHGLMSQANGYTVGGEGGTPDPAEQVVKDVASGKIDVGLVWGPIAGYFVAKDKLPLHIAFLKPDPNTPRVDYRIAMGVRPNELPWRRKLNRFVMTNQTKITAILQEYHVPLLDEMGRPIPPPSQPDATPTKLAPGP